MDVLQLLIDFWPHFLGAALTVAAIVATIHVVLNKTEPQAAVAWTGLIWLSPGLGPLLYYMLGINRIRRKAVALKSDQEFWPKRNVEHTYEALSKEFSNMGPGYIESLVHFGKAVGASPPTRNNSVVPLHNGDEAYPEMLKAIEEAKTSIALATYIFDNDEAGKRFVAALKSAVERNVEVRVLVDAAGARYSFPSIFRPLKKAKIRAAKFLPTLIPWKLAYVNLRNHRKVLIVDGKIGFTGGMNIRQGNCLKNGGSDSVQDLHFRIEGPVVAHLQECFVNDWAFAAGEVLEGESWFPPLAEKGSVLARGIPDGPDGDFEKIYWTVLGAISASKHSIRIMTPYFLPDTTLIRFLNTAAMAGIKVEIILPEVNNLKFVKWASDDLTGRLLQRGCRIYLSPPPFDHSKLMIVDNDWVLLGSSNWDPRSFRLNFEFNVGCFSEALATQMNKAFDAKLQQSRRLTLEDVKKRSLPVRLRGGIARLFTPYL